MLLRRDRDDGTRVAVHAMQLCLMVAGASALSGCGWLGQYQARKLAEAPETQAKVAALKAKIRADPSGWVTLVC